MSSITLRRALNLCGELSRKYTRWRTRGRGPGKHVMSISLPVYDGVGRILRTMSTSCQLTQGDRRLGPRGVIVPPFEPLPPTPTDELVRKVLASEDMKRVLGRELRKCGGDVKNINYSRMMYDSWNGFTEQIVLSHVGSKERLLQLIYEAMDEDPMFRGYVENAIHPSEFNYPPFGVRILGTRYLSWYLTGSSLLLAFLNYYLISILLFAGAVFISFYV